MIMKVRSIILFAALFVVSVAALIFVQGAFCWGGCNTTDNASNVAGFRGEVVNPTGNPLSDGVEYLSVTYQEENEISIVGDDKSDTSDVSGSSGDSGEINDQATTSKESQAISPIESSISSGSTSTGSSNGGTVNSLPVIAEECYGAENCNPTGNPIGGGVGYSQIISQTDPNVKYIVSTKSQLLTALANAKSGEVVFVKGTAAINMNGVANLVIPAGVTLASDRGLGGSSGALIKKNQNATNSWAEALFSAKEGARITGLRIEGEMKPKYDTSVPEQNYLIGIRANNRVVIDNCEIRGWSCAGIMSGTGTSGKFVYIHHNYIHHNQAMGEGYGIDVYGATALIEANIFDYNRHSIAGSGVESESYEARYNLDLGHTYDYEHRFDVHANPVGGTYSGNSYSIHHNTFKNEIGTGYDIKYRGSEPELGVWIDHNIFTWSKDWSSSPVYSYASAAGRSKTYVSNNLVGIPPTTLKRDGTGVIQFSAE